MKLQSKYLILSTLGIAAVWLVGVGLASSGSPTKPSTTVSFTPSTSARPRPILASSHSGVAEFGGGQVPQLKTVPGELAGKAFKNVTALPEISVADFMGTMGIMCAALGFDCSECHIRAGTEKVDWAGDTPLKVTARKMVNMVRAINKDNFGGRQVVTCWTCHRGRDKPLITPTIDYIYSEPPVFPDDVVVPTPGAPKAEPIIDKYLQAIGGEQKLKDLKSYVVKAKSVFFGGFGGAGDVQVFAQAPDRRTTIIHFPDAKERDDSTRTFNGKEGWVKTPLSVLGEYAVTGGELDGVRLDAMMGFPGSVRQTFTNLRVGGPATVNGRPTALVQGDGPGNTLTSMYFDTQSGLLVRVIRYTRSPIGRFPTQLDYSDYRDVKGIKMPFKWVFSWVDGKDTFEITDIQTNVAIDAARFERPSIAVVKK